jgi:hypothetical protein
LNRRPLRPEPNTGHGDLPQDGRAHALDVREIKTELVEIRAELAEVKSGVRQGFASVMARLDTLGGKG